MSRSYSAKEPSWDLNLCASVQDDYPSTIISPTLKRKRDSADENGIEKRQCQLTLNEPTPNRPNSSQRSKIGYILMMKARGVYKSAADIALDKEKESQMLNNHAVYCCERDEKKKHNSDGEESQ